jgi:hypothetical protein
MFNSITGLGDVGKGESAHGRELVFRGKGGGDRGNHEECVVLKYVYRESGKIEPRTG